jgi:hypothetical protein
MNSTEATYPPEGVRESLSVQARQPPGGLFVSPLRLPPPTGRCTMVQSTRARCSRLAHRAWAFDVHVYLVYHPSGCRQCAYVFIYIHADLIASRHVQARSNTGGPVGCACLCCCFFTFSLYAADGHGPPCSGVPLFFSLLEGPGEKTDWMDVTLSQVGEPLSLEGAGTFVLGGAKRDGRSCCRDVHGRRKWC